MLQEKQAFLVNLYLFHLSIPYSNALYTRNFLPIKNITKIEVGKQGEQNQHRDLKWKTAIGRCLGRNLIITHAYIRYVFGGTLSQW